LTLLLAVTGCAIPGVSSKNETAPPVTSQTSWTDKLTAPFKSLAPKKAEVEDLSKTDPISLGFASGPPTPSLYVAMAQMSDQGGNAAHARSMYQQALKIDEKNLDALLGLARMEDREGNLQEALRIYQQAVNNHPEDARALNDLALCQARCGDMQKSYELLSQAVKMRPEKQLYRNNIAKVLIEMNQLDQAAMQLAAVYDPAVANYNMAALLQERGRTAEAVPFLHKALAANPQFAEAHTMLTNITGGTQVQQAAAAMTSALSSPISISAPLAGTAPIATQPVMPVSMGNDITPTPYGPSGLLQVNNGPAYPSTGVPQVIPMPAQTASVPVGYQPTSLPAIR
jgi:tetratricopeptide (TPR) repeat protein